MLRIFFFLKVLAKSFRKTMDDNLIISVVIDDRTVDIKHSSLKRELTKFMNIKNLSTHVWSKLAFCYHPDSQEKVENVPRRFRYLFYKHFHVFQEIKKISNKIYEDMWLNGVVERLKYLETTFNSIDNFIAEQLNDSETICGLPVPSEMMKINQILNEIHRDNVCQTIDEINDILEPINLDFINHIRQLRERDINNSHSSTSCQKEKKKELEKEKN